MKFFVQGKDIVAALLIAGCFYLKANGLDGTVDKILLGIAVAYGLVNYVTIPKRKG